MAWPGAPRRSCVSWKWQWPSDRLNADATPFSGWTIPNYVRRKVWIVFPGPSVGRSNDAISRRNHSTAHVSPRPIKIPGCRQEPNQFAVFDQADIRNGIKRGAEQGAPILLTHSGTALQRHCPCRKVAGTQCHRIPRDLCDIGSLRCSQLAM